MDSNSGYWLTRLLLQRGIGFIYLVAFLVVVNQFRPLCGEKGLLPVSRFIQVATFRESPSIFFLFPKDGAFAFFGWCGVMLAVLATTGLSERYGTWVSMTVWALLWVIYLSFVNIGQTFYAFGWESLLLESGFLAIFLGAAHVEPSAVPIWLFRWVLFRVIFGAGMIKLRGDPCWQDLTCLDYHFETQPMPNPLSWYFHWLPGWMHKGGVLFNHLVEVVAPFCYFAPQPASAIAGITVVLFQGALLVSGNFSWLSLFTLVLAFSTFDDALLGRLLPFGPPPLEPQTQFNQGMIWGAALLVALLSVKPILNLFSRYQIMNTNYNPYHLVNTYGAFGSITRERYEIVLEGTDETVVTATTRWREYGFKGKPGDPCGMPPQIAPYHLRLDWLMWFAAMPSPYYDPWFIHLLAKMLEGDAPTISLLRSNPFPDTPPSYVRALHYRYHFTTPEEHKRTGCWWQRELAGTYFPPVSRNDPALRSMLKEFVPSDRE
jgi:hypothetical protein